MIITEHGLAMEKRMVGFFDQMADRVARKSPKLDYCLLIDGYEGYGKSNFAATVCQYVSEKTGRDFDMRSVFFDPEKLIEYATNNKNKIIWWDEMALAALAMQHGDKWQLAIIQTLMMARKNRHFFVFCIPRFYRLKEAIIERTMGLVHVYARNEKILGRFTFYKRKNLEYLYEDWKKKRRKPNYWRHKTIKGTFGESLSRVLDEKAYELKKDEAIKQILERMKGKKVSKRAELYRKKAMQRLEFIKNMGLMVQYCEVEGISEQSAYKEMRNARHVLTVPSNS